MKTTDIKTAATKDLVAFYNANADKLGKKVITKFADRATAEARVAQMIEEIAALAPAKKAKPAKTEEKAKYNYAKDGCPNCKATEDQTAAGLDGTVAGDERNFCHVCSTEYWRETGKIYKAPKASETRSRGISESWNDPEIAAKRAARHNVKVVLGGKDMGIYRSTLDAFKKLNLPQNGHIKFRMALKEAGKLDFVHGDRTYKFSIVKQEELAV